MQLLNIKHGGTVKPGVTREYGPAKLILATDCALFKGVSHESQVWMSHSDTCQDRGGETKIIATNEDGVPVALQWSETCFGIQFHPEVTHSHEGTAILNNFLTNTGAKLAKFDIQAFKAQMLEQIKADVGDREVICGVSGGVDSTVLAVLLQRAGVKVRAIYIDNGLMRLNETADVVAQFKEVGVPIEVVDASERFLTALKGETDEYETHMKAVYTAVLCRDPDALEWRGHLYAYRAASDPEATDALLREELYEGYEYHDILKQRIRETFIELKNKDPLPSQQFALLKQALLSKDTARDPQKLAALIAGF